MPAEDYIYFRIAADIAVKQMQRRHMVDICRWSLDQSTKRAQGAESRPTEPATDNPDGSLKKQIW